jgi:lysyl-tRNA synthetase class 2
MPQAEELKQKRLEKLQNIKEKGINPYPVFIKKHRKIKDVISDFKEGNEVALVGRILAMRTHGGSTFLNFSDGTGKFQAFLREDLLGKEPYQFFLKNIDIGDFLLFEGRLFLTKTKEKTIEVKNFEILAKALFPIPSEWYGLEDVEERYRKRYLDLLINEEVKNKFILRSKILSFTRKFFEKNGFIEVETPILQKEAGGAAATPFKTHLNALNIDLYLRIAPEIYLKMLLIAGFDKVFEMGKVFRNEGVDRSHNPEFTSLEFYQAYTDYFSLMNLIENYFKELTQTIFGKNEIEYQGKKIKFNFPFERIEFDDLLCEEIGAPPSKLTEKEIIKIGKAKEVPTEGKHPSKILDGIFKKRCLQKIWQPTFVLHQPVELTPLAKAREDNKKVAARFQLVIAGWEVANGFSELNDPLEQEERFRAEEILKKKGDLEAHPFDKEFLEALTYGMPPAAGCGIGMDRLCAILTNSQNIREIILFPLMK